MIRIASLYKGRTAVHISVRHALVFAVAAILQLATTAARLHAQEGEIVRGRILGPLNVPIPNALVTVTSAQSQMVRSIRTDSTGIYVAFFGTGDREYVVDVRALGFSPQNVHLRRNSESPIIVRDIHMRFVVITLSRPYALDTVPIIAQRILPPRAVDLAFGQEWSLTRYRPFVFDKSDLLALAASAPSVQALTGFNGDTTGYSVLGMSPEQNNIIVDGSTFGGRPLPRDAIASSQIATTTFDAGRGNFAGGQISATTRSGSDFMQGNFRVSTSGRQLSWVDPEWSSPIPMVVSASGSVGGPIRPGKAYYFTAAEFRRSTTALWSLLEPRPIDLDRAGLTADTISTVGNTLMQLGVPLTRSEIPTDRGDMNLSGFVKLDFVPRQRSTLTFRADASVQEQLGNGVYSFGFPSLASRGSNTRGGLQASSSGYFGDILESLQSYVEFSHYTSAPYVNLPQGFVNVSTQLPDGREGLTSLQFGGATNEAQTSTIKWETRNEIAWLAGENKHRVKFGQSITLDRTNSEQRNDPLGQFSYATLGDLQANHPSSYSRHYSSRRRGMGSIAGALWVGDEWRVNQRLNLEYGLRADAVRATRRPPHNSAVDSLFGLSTSFAPENIGLSPRLGFSWMTRYMVTGGIGAFRGVIPPSRVAAQFDAAGLPSSSQLLECVGDATPSPDWTLGPAAAPTACTDGAAPVTFSTTQPNVSAFDRYYHAPVSWRANLNLDNVRLKKWFVRGGITYSFGTAGESTMDLNLRRTPAFSLANEGGRAVYVPRDAIVPTTGAIAPGASRVSDLFTRVMAFKSDMGTRAFEAQLSLSPPRPIFLSSTLGS